ncbi:MAG: TonB-dependent receptor, partial [Steroidobacteraceae bacterium]
SFGRRAFEAQTGGASGAFDYFLTANDFHDDGWRDQSPTDARQVFGKFGWQTSTTDVDLSYTWADNSMFGNGATPQSMLEFRRDAVYSVPDYTHNHLNFVNTTVTQFLTDTLLLSGNVYYRDLETGSSNGDVNDGNYLSGDYEGPAIDCSAAPMSLVDNAYCANGINRVSQLSQRTAGLGLQLTDSADWLGARNQAIFGADFDHSRDTYDQSFRYATLTALRTAVSDSNPYNPLAPVNSLAGSNQILGIYFTDTLSPNELLHFTASARYNRNTETLHGFSVDTDVGDFGDGFNDANPLTGGHTFSRVNPAFGFTVTPTHSLTLYANYDEASRAPTVIELGCANPEEPCGLPNDFASDPSLAQVVSRTVAAGARGQLAGKALTWSIDAFHTLNENDIQFVATTTSEGYFANVGNTKRQGLDLALGGAALQRLHWHLVYSFVDATYRSTFAVNAESNSTANADGNVEVRPGDRIPLIPRHTGRLILDYDVTPAWNIGANVIVSSGAFLHGNENNANVAGGTNGEGAYVIGSGEVGGYTVVNLDSTYHVTSALDVFLRLDNLFDRNYATAGFLTDDSFTPSGAFRTDPADWTNENSVSPAQPRAAWVGVRLHFK